MILDNVDKQEAIVKIEKAIEYLWQAQDLIKKPEITSENYTLLLGLVERATKNVINSLSDLDVEDEHLL
jgi:hypothetical protein